MKIIKPVLIGSLIGTAFGSAIIMKDYFGGNKFEVPDMAEGKVIVITGANTGIGKETALEFAKRKAVVIMACRDIAKCEEARKGIVFETRNKHVYCRVCDLASTTSIRNFAERFLKDHHRLDVLVNNAGVMRCPYTKTKEGIELQLGVNHMGHFLLTNLLLERIKESTPSRIVVLSSAAHKRGKINKDDLNSEKNYDKISAYNQSKLANVLFTKELAKKLKGSGVTVNAIHPGIVDTEITRHMSFFNSYIAALLIKPFLWIFIKSPKQAAQTVLHACLSPDLENVTGKYFSECKEAEVSQEANDENLAKWLWLVSEKWTRLSS